MAHLNFFIPESKKHYLCHGFNFKLYNQTIHPQQNILLTERSSAAISLLARGSSKCGAPARQQVRAPDRH